MKTMTNTPNEMPDNETDRSLVTFALFAYNQEKYIREAVKGAFSQTYEPLEIILSDDCSSDRTFEIMQEMASAYDGPHRVTCLKHKENLGLANHINKIAEVAKGEITVMAAGDDRSLPQRTAEHLAVYQLWPDTKAVYSNYSLAHHETPDIPTGEANSNIRINTLRNLISGGGLGAGATYSYNKNCFTWPGKIPSTIKHEDRILPFRAAIMGEIRRINSDLVIYGLDNMHGDRTIRTGPGAIEKSKYWDHHRKIIDVGNANGKINTVKARTLIFLTFYLENCAIFRQSLKRKHPVTARIFWSILIGPLRIIARAY